MKLKLFHVTPLKKALVALDGSYRMVGGNSVYITSEYSRKFVQNNVKNLGALKRAEQNIEDLRTAVAKKFAGGAKVVPPDKIEAYQAEYAQHLNDEDEIPLLGFTEEALNLFDPKENPTGNLISASTLLALELLVIRK